MACPILTLSNEVFGLPASWGVLTTAGTQPPDIADMEWLGITFNVVLGTSGSGTQYSDLVFNTAHGEMINVSAPNNGKVGIEIEGKDYGEIEWVSRAPGTSNLMVTRSKTPANFIIFVSTTTISNPGLPSHTERYRFCICNFKETIPSPVIVEMEGVPGAAYPRFAHNRNGQLGLFWTAGSSPGFRSYKAELFRIDSDRPLLGALVNLTGPLAGFIGCSVSTTPKNIELFTGGPTSGSFSRPANPPDGMPVSVPGAILSISPARITLSGSVRSRTFTVENTGNDFLQLDSLSFGSSTDISVSPNVGFPFCLSPGQSKVFAVQRKVDSGATITILVNTTPSMPNNDVTVELVAIPVIATPPTIFRGDPAKLRLVPQFSRWAEWIISKILRLLGIR